MSGVHRLVLAENKGQAQPTNEDLKEEGIGSAAVDAATDKEEGDK